MTGRDVDGLPAWARQRLNDASHANFMVDEGDRRYFARHRERKHRIRLASRQEIDAASRCLNGGRLPSGRAWFMCVCQLAPGVYLRVLTANNDQRDTDVPEHVARAVFQALASPWMRNLVDEVESALREQMAGGGQ